MAAAVAVAGPVALAPPALLVWWGVVLFPGWVARGRVWLGLLWGLVCPPCSGLLCLYCAEPIGLVGGRPLDERLLLLPRQDCYLGVGRSALLRVWCLGLLHLVMSPLRLPPLPLRLPWLRLPRRMLGLRLPPLLLCPRSASLCGGTP